MGVCGASANPHVTHKIYVVTHKIYYPLDINLFLTRYTHKIYSLYILWVYLVGISCGKQRECSPQDIISCGEHVPTRYKLISCGYNIYLVGAMVLWVTDVYVVENTVYIVDKPSCM